MSVSRDEYIACLRELADMLEGTPDRILPYSIERGETFFYPKGARLH